MRLINVRSLATGGLAIFVAASALVGANAATVKSPITGVPDKVISAGPANTSSDAALSQVATRQYFETVCPTVLAHPDKWASDAHGTLLKACQQMQHSG
jgi:hypothetical protein